MAAPVLTVKLLRNGLTIFAILYVVIHSLSSSPASLLVLGDAPPPPLSAQDTAFVNQCRVYFETSALRRNRCDDPPSQLCQNICTALTANLPYFAALWPLTLLPACDATCAAHQSSICTSAISYFQLCDATARARLMLASPDQVHVTVQDDRTSGPAFVSLLVLIFVATSDILVSLSEYKAKYLTNSDNEYDASQLDASAALVAAALHAANEPEHLLTVAKTCFELRCLLFDNSCDQALEIIVLFQVASFLWTLARGRAAHLLPTFDKGSPTSPSTQETEGQFQETPPTRSSSGSTSGELSKTQSMAAFTQSAPPPATTARPTTAHLGSREGQPPAATPVSPPPLHTATPATPAPSAFGKLSRLMQK
ncbi:Aste57867_18649 [Aphanomyces stellatus]|uniref:Aste57867_18649 protein n=1 Tax=Aphanomyces stellatus TaxID=120398 RepID=A0A485LAN8_9STRA|nr:hypothetical protein As57867_018587 [Aphanomyces stellatus]VFT95384.1 Aste57867_18649 [Aphanomyces stellatus]